jgi:hypothetical protein
MGGAFCFFFIFVLLILEPAREPAWRYLVSTIPTVAPGNIWSGNHSPLAVLTNPTALAKRKGNLRNDYPVRHAGALFGDAEAVYHSIVNPLKARGYVPQRTREMYSAYVAALKLSQHPQIVAFIEANGGAPWLRACCHFLSATRRTPQSFWEGHGESSAFIRSLIRAYGHVTQQAVDHDIERQLVIYARPLTPASWS